MINNIEHFGGIFGKGSGDSEKKKKINYEDKINILNINSKNLNGSDYAYDIISKKCIKKSEMVRGYKAQRAALKKNKNEL